MVACVESMPRCLQPLVPIDRRNADRIPGFACELRRMMAHRSAVAFAEGMYGIQLVDVIAELGEKHVLRKAAEAVLLPDVGEPLVEFACDVECSRKIRCARTDVHGAVLACPVINVLKQVLMQRAISVCVWGEREAQNLSPARERQSTLRFCKRLTIGGPEPVAKRLGARIRVGIIRQRQAAI